MEGSTVWCAETSAAHFTVTTAWRYIDDRIRTLHLRPDPGPLEPALRSIRGGVPGVVSIRDLPGRTVRFWVYAVDPHLCHTDVSFEVWAQDVLVGRYATAREAEANWSILGPFKVTVAEDRELAIEGRQFRGLGGIAAIRLEAADQALLGAGAAQLQP